MTTKRQIARVTRRAVARARVAVRLAATRLIVATDEALVAQGKAARIRQRRRAVKAALKAVAKSVAIAGTAAATMMAARATARAVQRRTPTPYTP